MKLKKNISKIITLSILINNMCFYSNASSLNRYETLEGDIITLDNVESKDIKEIEIFGNTVQDQNNLKDIQSVGDLYVNEEGEPILDKLGREQYKIEIESHNDNFYNENYLRKQAPNLTYIDGGIEIPTKDLSASTLNFTNPNRFNSNLQYVLKLQGKTVNNSLSIKIGFQYSDGTYSMFTLHENNDIEYSVKSIAGKTIAKVGILGFWTSSGDGYVKLSNIQLGVSGTYVSPKSYKTTILLPCQLMKVGNVADRLYWDSEKRKYIVEKKTYNFLVNGIDNYPQSYKIANKDKKNGDIIGGYSYINKGEYRTNLGWGTVIYSKPKNGFTYVTPGYIRVYIDTSINDVEDELNSINEFLTQNPINITSILTTSQLIETNITEQIKLPTYTDKTYISTASENGINPTLRITIDRIEQTSQEAVDIAISNPTSNNLALARMFVNMLPDSLYKDQLQAQLNNIFSSDIVLDKKIASSNLDLYIKSENILMMSLDTNTITFEDFSSTEDMEKVNAINLTVNSSLPYQVNAYLPNEIQNNDKSNTMNKDILNIKESSEQIYRTFANINEKVILKDNCIAGNGIKHSIDLLLKGGIAHAKDVYKTTIKLEIEQK